MTTILMIAPCLANARHAAGILPELIPGTEGLPVHVVQVGWSGPAEAFDRDRIGRLRALVPPVPDVELLDPRILTAGRDHSEDETLPNFDPTGIGSVADMVVVVVLGSETHHQLAWFQAVVDRLVGSRLPPEAVLMVDALHASDEIVPWGDTGRKAEGPASIHRRLSILYAVNATQFLAGPLRSATCGELDEKLETYFLAHHEPLQALYRLRAAPGSSIGGDTLPEDRNFRDTLYSLRTLGLVGGRFVSPDGFPSKGDVLTTTERADVLLDLLHPDCEMPDLAKRFERIPLLETEEAHRRIDATLKRLFGRQARRFARDMSEGMAA